MSGSAPHTFKVTVDEFERDVINASKDRVVLVFFWGPWCGLCRQLIPQVEELILKSGGTIRLGLAHVGEVRETADELGVRGLPSMFAFRRGECVDQILGNPPTDFLENWLNRLIADAVDAGEQETDPN